MFENGNILRSIKTGNFYEVVNPNNTPDKNLSFFNVYPLSKNLKRVGSYTSPLPTHNARFIVFKGKKPSNHPLTKIFS